MQYAFTCNIDKKFTDFRKNNLVKKKLNSHFLKDHQVEVH